MEKFKIVPYTNTSISDEKELASAKAFLLDVKGVRNRIEAERKELTKPLLDSKKKIDDKYKSIDAPFEKMEMDVKALMVDYLNHKEAQIKEEAGKDVAKLAIKDERVSFRLDYDVEVIDITKVAKEFLLVDESLVKQRIREGQNTFAGLKITEKKIIIGK